MRQGLYALISLDGGPLDPVALGMMGLAEDSITFSGGAIRMVDARSGAAASFIQTAEHVTALLGYLDEPEQLASALGMSAESAPAALAKAAFERYGAETPNHILGEWVLLHVNVALRTISLCNSLSCRDVTCFSIDGRQIAIGPGMVQLSKLPWNTPGIDLEGLAMTMSRAGLRHAIGSRTMWKGVSRLRAGTTEVFGPGARATTGAGPRPALTEWRGTFEDAVAELDVLGRRIVRQHVDRYDGAAFLLSGGLDSTLLTAWGALEQGSGREIVALCSVAPHGSGLRDEREYATAAAKQLGVRLEFVTPPEHWSVFRPDASVFRHAEMPAVGVRHYVYEALQQAAEAQGAHAVLDGVYGEMSVTRDGPPPPHRTSPREMLRAARAWAMDRLHRPNWPDGAFQVKFSKELLAEVPRDWQQLWRSAPLPAATTLGLIGEHPAARKNAQLDTATSSTQRHLMPFRDERFFRALAPMPAEFLTHGGQTRAIARALLRNRVPDVVRLRRLGAPFSPDYNLRVQRQAEEARKRIPAYRDAGLQLWLDLEWLEVQLGALAAGDNGQASVQFRAQITTLTAEFLLWASAQ